MLGIVHATAYSLLLLNTDLHVAELATRMSKNQFVRNTITAIQMQVQPSEISSPDTPEGSGLNKPLPEFDGSETIKSTARSKRSASITSWKSISKDTIVSSPQTGNSSLNGSTISVQATSSQDSKSNNASTTLMIYGRAWEIEMESLLKVCDVILCLVVV